MVKYVHNSSTLQLEHQKTLGGAKYAFSIHEKRRKTDQQHFIPLHSGRCHIRLDICDDLLERRCARVCFPAVRLVRDRDKIIRKKSGKPHKICVRLYPAHHWRHHRGSVLHQ